MAQARPSRGDAGGQAGRRGCAQGRTGRSLMAFAAPSRRLPWQPAALLAVLATTAVGFVVIGVGWLGASGAVAPHRQIVWLDVAAAGVLVAGVGNGLWLLAGRRALG